MEIRGERVEGTGGDKKGESERVEMRYSSTYYRVYVHVQTCSTCTV